MLNLLPAVRECAWLQNEGPLESGSARKRSPGGRQQSHIPRVLQAMEDFDAEVMQLCQLATRDGASAFDAIAGGVARPILKVRWSHGSVVNGDVARSERSCPANRALMAYRMCCICAELEGNRKRYRYVCSSEYSRGGSRGPAASSRWFPRPAQASAAGKAHKKAKAPRRSQSEFICRRCAQRRRGAQCVETRVQLHFVHWPRELLHFGGTRAPPVIFSPLPLCSGWRRQLRRPRGLDCLQARSRIQVTTMISELCNPPGSLLASSYLSTGDQLACLDGGDPAGQKSSGARSTVVGARCPLAMR